MALPDFQSLCQEKQKIIVSKDKGESRRHIAHNENNHKVTHYKIDGVVIKTGERCDFLLFDEEIRRAYLIELKGSDLVRASRQLETTERELRQSLNGYQLQYRIAVSKARTHAIKHVEFRRFEKKCKASLKYSTELLEDYL